VPGALPAAIGANAMGKGLICPAACGSEAAWAGEDVDILAAAHLLSLVNHFKGHQLLARPNAFHQAVLAQTATADTGALQTLIPQTHSATAAITNLYGLSLQQSTVMAYADAQWALGALTFFLLPLVFVLPRRRKGAAAPVHIPAE